jgi:hypothetical protein
MRQLLLATIVLIGMTSFAQAQPSCRPIQWCADGNWLDKHCWCYQRYGYGRWGQGRWGDDGGWDDDDGRGDDGGWDDDDGAMGTAIRKESAVIATTIEPRR